jgi:hypothetical protein
MLLTMLLWLALLNPGRADRLVDNLVGFQNEYRAVLGTGLLAVVLSFVAAMRGAKAWYAVAFLALGTLGFFTFALSR